MTHKARRRNLAIVLMLGVTIVAGTGLVRRSDSVASVRRFLAVDNHSRQVLMTVVTDASTAISSPGPLHAGLQVRVYGVQVGRTIRAHRIERMY